MISYSGHSDDDDCYHSPRYYNDVRIKRHELGLAYDELVRALETLDDPFTSRRAVDIADAIERYLDKREALRL